MDHGFLVFVGISVQFAVDHGGAHVIRAVHVGTGTNLPVCRLPGTYLGGFLLEA
jgi:hypothetical protein